MASKEQTPSKPQSRQSVAAQRVADIMATENLTPRDAKMLESVFLRYPDLTDDEALEMLRDACA